MVVVFTAVASAPTNLMAVQEGPTSIRVSWSPPTPLEDTTGYRIFYSVNNSSDSVDNRSDSVDVSGGSTDNYTLTGLQNGESYNISIWATSEHFFSDISQEIPLGLSMKIPLYNKLYCMCKDLAISLLSKTNVKRWSACTFPGWSSLL